MWPAAVKGQTSDGKSALSQTDSAAEEEPLTDVMDTNSGLKTSSQTICLHSPWVFQTSYKPLCCSLHFCVSKGSEASDKPVTSKHSGRLAYLNEKREK